MRREKGRYVSFQKPALPDPMNEFLLFFFVSGTGNGRNAEKLFFPFFFCSVQRSCPTSRLLKVGTRLFGFGGANDNMELMDDDMTLT